MCVSAGCPFLPLCLGCQSRLEVYFDTVGKNYKGLCVFLFHLNTTTAHQFVGTHPPQPTGGSLMVPYNMYAAPTGLDASGTDGAKGAGHYLLVLCGKEIPAVLKLYYGLSLISEQTTGLMCCFRNERPGLCDFLRTDD